MIVDAMIVPRPRRAHFVVKLRAMKQRLAHFPQLRLAVHFEAELLAHHARSAVAADHVLRVDRDGLAVCLSDLRGNAAGLLAEHQQFVAEFHRQIWHPFGHGFQQRLKRILGNDLIGFERH